MKHDISNGLSFVDSDVVNPDDWQTWGRFYVVHDHGFTVGCAFADCLGDALDEIADSGKLAQFEITEDERADYAEDDSRISYLGNYGVAHDIEALQVVELAPPKLSIAALYNAASE